jgi:hypothetical protein
MLTFWGIMKGNQLTMLTFWGIMKGNQLTMLTFWGIMKGNQLTMLTFRGIILFLGIVNIYTANLKKNNKAVAWSE